MADDDVMGGVIGWIYYINAESEEATGEPIRLRVTPCSSNQINDHGFEKVSDFLFKDGDQIRIVITNFDSRGFPICVI